MPAPDATLYDPLAWNFYSRMHEVYDRLRETDPVHWYEYRSEWILTRHADVQAVLRDPAMLPMQVRPGIANLEAASGVRLSRAASFALWPAFCCCRRHPGT